MSKFVFCSNCGMKIPVGRKAMPNFGRVIDLINPHECSEKPIELDLGPSADIPVFEDEGDGKFVQNLNELQPSLSISTADLRDRRIPADIKSAAPQSLVDNIQSLQHSIPAHEPVESEGEQDA